MNGGGIFAPTNRGGGEAITSEKITLTGTIKEISLFPLMYALTCFLQVALLAIEAALIGIFSGPIFLALAFLFDFSPAMSMRSNPVEIKISFAGRYSAGEKPGHVKQAQRMLAVFGFVIATVSVISELPCIWPWGVTWAGGGDDVLFRLGAIFALPFILWSALRITQWSAQMEAVRPKQREAAVGEVSPENVEGPFGEDYIPAMRKPEPQRPTPVTVVEPRPYSDRQLENEGGQG